MKARSVARQLAFFALFQTSDLETLKELSSESFNTLVVDTIRSLTNLATDQLETAGHRVTGLLNQLEDIELQHPDNKHMGFDDPIKPVPMPTTEEMRHTLGQILSSIENIYEALELPEFKALSKREDVQNYTRMLLNRYMENHTDIDLAIDAASHEWRVDRLQKPDLTLLRIATTEMVYAKGVDVATVIDETLELAKRVTDEESVKYIHGVLGQISELRASQDSDSSDSQEASDPLLALD